ncbi:MAG: hypothetical protein JW807_06025 [Spirochaetes bacterium]|nr:hypothetical protein [Spirochaetota bacterium]
MKKIQELTRSVEIDAGPDHCYAVVCDIKGYMSWFKHIKTMDIKAADPEGRPSRVLFTFDLLIKKNMQIILNYEYDDADRRLRFGSGGGDIQSAGGHYHFRELSPDRTLLVFSLRVDFGMLVPQQIVDFLSGRVLDDFLAMIREECERRKGQA